MLTVSVHGKTCLLLLHPPPDLRAIPFEILRRDGGENFADSSPHILIFFLQTPPHIFFLSLSRTPPQTFLFSASPPSPPQIFKWNSPNSARLIGCMSMEYSRHLAQLHLCFWLTILLAIRFHSLHALPSQMFSLNHCKMSFYLLISLQSHTSINQ